MIVTSVEELRMRERTRVLKSDQPQRKPDTVIVKLRSSRTAVRRFVAAARDPAALRARGAAIATAPQPFLAIQFG